MRGPVRPRRPQAVDGRATAPPPARSGPAPDTPTPDRIHRHRHRAPASPGGRGTPPGVTAARRTGGPGPSARTPAAPALRSPARPGRPGRNEEGVPGGRPAHRAGTVALGDSGAPSPGCGRRAPHHSGPSTGPAAVPAATRRTRAGGCAQARCGPSRAGTGDGRQRGGAASAPQCWTRPPTGAGATWPVGGAVRARARPTSTREDLRRPATSATGVQATATVSPFGSGRSGPPVTRTR